MRLTPLRELVVPGIIHHGVCFVVTSAATLVLRFGLDSRHPDSPRPGSGRLAEGLKALSLFAESRQFLLRSSYLAQVVAVLA